VPRRNLVVGESAASERPGRHRNPPHTPINPDHSRYSFLPLLVLWAAVSTVLPSAGCSRMFWRTQADFDAYNELLKKTQDPRWDLPRITVEADPRSRFYDPHPLDIAPLPPDDPTANQYMRWVDGMKGYKSWHKFGELMSVENPQWLAQFGLAPELYQADWERPLSRATTDETGQTIPPAEEEDATDTTGRVIPTLHGLTLEQAIELAAIHSREYQEQIENLYRSALLLTFDQFQFQVRYLGLNGGEPTSNLTYLNTPSVRDDWSFNNRFGMRQLLPTGGQWAVELANNTLWLFSGGNQTNSASILSYSLTQPLLLGAGRKVVLENLTLSERNVLYDVRTLARFRKIFFSNIVANGRSVGNVGAGAAGGASGFLGLLLRSQQVTNQRNNIRQLAIQIERLRQLNAQPPEAELEQWPEGVVIPPELQEVVVYDAKLKKLTWPGAFSDQLEQQVLALSDDAEYQKAVTTLTARLRAGVVTLDLAQLITRLSSQETQLRDAERSYLDAVDQYKLLIGLPTDLQLTIRKRVLKQFELIDPGVDDAEQQLVEFKRELATIDETAPSVDDLKAALEGLLAQRDVVSRGPLSLVADDLRRVDAILPRRLEELKNDADRQTMVSDLERNRLVFQQVVLEEFSKAAAQIDSLEQFLANAELSLEERRSFLTNIDRVREKLLQITQSSKAVQVGLRSELITLEEFNMSQEQVVASALENRLDLMNARGAVMDARRQMEVAANRLEAVLNLVARGDVGTSGGNKPFDFRGDRSTFQFGVQFTAPLDQVLERNAYRQALLNYQQARRDYMELEDLVKFDVRAQWRALQAQRLNFETARQNLRIAALQLDSAIETFNQPPAVGQSALQNRSQNQGLNLINALSSVLAAQNQIIQIWINYEQNRINIHRDMDIMQVDERGLWIDPVYQNLGREPSPPAEPSTADPPVIEPTDDTANLSPAWDPDDIDNNGVSVFFSEQAAGEDVEAVVPAVGWYRRDRSDWAVGEQPDGDAVGEWDQPEAGRARLAEGDEGSVPDHSDGAWDDR
jgi:outer membrane protein TolC